MSIKRQPSSFEIIKDSVSHTPDFINLSNCMYDEFLVFLFGKMRNDGIKKDFLKGCNYYGEGVTWSDDFILKEGPFGTHSYHPEPMAFELPKENRVQILKKFEGAGQMSWSLSGQIEGDIYGVPLRTLTKLDQYEGNTDTVTRVPRWITLKSPKSEAKQLKAYVYVIDWERYEEYNKHYGKLMSCNYYLDPSSETKNKVYYYKDYSNSVGDNDI